MIQANELRLGNYVSIFPDGDSPYQLDRKNLSWILSSEWTKQKEIGADAVIYPVPLSSDMLTEWCGFSKTNSKVFRKDHLVLSLDLDLNWGTGHTNIALINGTVIAHPYKLHHLQNLWHSLYQRELEIKIPVKS